MNQIYKAGGLVQISGKEYTIHDSFCALIAIRINGKINWIPSELIESYTPPEQTEWITEDMWTRADRSNENTCALLNRLLNKKFGLAPVILE